MRHVVMYSGGLGSYETARRVRASHGSDSMTLLFCDTRTEDPDLYRFVEETSDLLGVEVTTLTEGRDVWEVFFDERYLGNSRADPCSKILKRRISRRWVNEHCDPAADLLYIGIDWSEINRMTSIVEAWKPFTIEAPLTGPPYLTKAQIKAELRRVGIEPPRLYELGFPHNNCGGFCVKAGLAQFKLLLETMPTRYKYHERREQELRTYLGKDVTILRETRGGELHPITLEEFRIQLESGAQQGNLLDWGGCGCFTTEDRQ